MEQNRKTIRYALVGLGHIAQVAVIPAFRNAKRNSKLVAFISDDEEKLRELGDRHYIEHRGNYDDFEAVLERANVDAVYIALPNHLHAPFTVRAARAGVHVLVEKPMAVTEQECEQMVEAAVQNDIKLMVAYRLHFEESNLKAIQRVQELKVGEPRIIEATNTMTVKDPDNIRFYPREQGGGPLYDAGVYCINAARYLFRAEPEEVTAMITQPAGDERFRDVEQTLSAVLRFSENRIATFTCSFDGAAVSEFRVIGTKGDLRVENAFEYTTPMTHWLTIDAETRRQKFRKRDQFAPELLYFSDCIAENRPVEPSAREGLADVRVIRALYESVDTGQTVKLPPFDKRRRPDMAQETHRPAVSKPKTVNVSAASE